MDRWVGQIAVVTGASSGIGAACCKELVEQGMIVVGLARRIDRMEKLRADLSTKASNLHVVKCDVTSEMEVDAVFAEIVRNHGPISVLINNAGIVRHSKLTGDNNGTDLRSTLETNVLGIAYCTREAFRSMRRHGINGHVILINSVVGHKVVQGGFTNLYSPSKYAVTAMTEVYRNEFNAENTKVKITSISPGMVKTEITEKFCTSAIPHLYASDIANAVIYVLQTPPHVQIHELIMKPIGEKF